MSASKRKVGWSIRELRSALRQLDKFLSWERDVIEQFHSYAREYGCQPGGNVFQFVLDDARKMRRAALEREKDGSK
jgi:hypothetical protein